MRLSSPFFHHAITTNKVMLMVILALIPGALTQIYWFGLASAVNLLFAGIIAVATEALVLKLRQRPIIQTISDNSALLTGLLIGLAIPSTLPLWMTIIGVSFAIVFGKHLYGGLGFNPFNPAMVGYVVLLISFPVEMTSWLPAKSSALLTAEMGLTPITSPGLMQSIELILWGKTSSGLTSIDFKGVIDGVTSATPLDYVKTQYAQGKMGSEIFAQDGLQTEINASQWVNAGYFLGGLFLLASKIIRWQIPLSLLSGLILTSAALHAIDPDLYSGSGFHLTVGATMLGAFFIATDPVSASTTPKGRIIYGFSIGFLVIIIRTFGGYPEAMAFAVLLLNILAPTLDHYTKPTIYGQQAAQTND